MEDGRRERGRERVRVKKQGISQSLTAQTEGPESAPTQTKNTKKLQSIAASLILPSAMNHQTNVRSLHLHVPRYSRTAVSERVLCLPGGLPGKAQVQKRAKEASSNSVIRPCQNCAFCKCADLLTRRRGLWSVGACASQSRRVSLALLLLARWCMDVFPLPPVTHRRPANPFQHFPWGCFAFFPTRPAFTQLCSSSSNTGHPSSPAVLRAKEKPLRRGTTKSATHLPICSACRWQQHHERQLPQGRGGCAAVLA